jgi:hypothetical protein
MENHMDRGKSKRFARDEELLACLASGQPVPAELDAMTQRIATLLKTLRADAEVYRVVVIRQGEPLGAQFLVVRPGDLHEGGKG